MKVFHCATPRKLDRYRATGCILPPVRYWTTEYSAWRWMHKTGRTVLLTFEKPSPSYPLPMKGGAEWSPSMVRDYELFTRSMTRGSP